MKQPRVRGTGGGGAYDSFEIVNEFELSFFF
jgi:hypothetical protein